MAEKCQTFYRCADGSEIQCLHKGYLRQHGEQKALLCPGHHSQLDDQTYRPPPLRLNKTNMERIAEAIFGGQPAIKGYYHMRLDLSRALHSLKGRERFVLIHRFGLDGKQPLTLEQIGEVLGVTREAVHKVESKAMERLRRSHPF